ncbi:MAG TPA: ABC transporter permease [Acidimicrobiales bacterium]
MPTPLPLRSFGYWAFQYKRTWRSSLTSSFLNPILFLAAMGVGLGSLVDKSAQSSSQLGGVSYLVFLAPGLLAASAMQTAAQESTYPVMGAIKWIRTYHAMLATPLRIIDVLVGHLAWIAVRLLLVTTVFVIVMAAFGATESWTVIFAIPAAILTGMAFAAPIAAFAATRNDDVSFAALFRFLVIPMFLFSGTFFPVTQLPLLLRLVAYLTPLWNGVDLCRDLALGEFPVGRTILHVAYLTVWVVVGVVAGARTYRRRLVN